MLTKVLQFIVLFTATVMVAVLPFMMAVLIARLLDWGLVLMTLTYLVLEGMMRPTAKPLARLWKLWFPEAEVTEH